MKRMIGLLLVFALLSGVMVFCADETTTHFPKVREYVDRTYNDNGEPNPGTYNDVNKYHWFYDSVKVAYETSFMTGTSQYRFSANESSTVAEIITIASRMHSTYINDGEKFIPPNYDREYVESTSWYQVYIDYAIKENIIYDGQFSNYNELAKRHDVATIFSSTFPLDFYSVVKSWESIPDVPESEPYHYDVIRLFNAGILSGNDEKGTFYPYSEIKRSEVAAIIKKIIDKDHENIIQE